MLFEKVISQKLFPFHFCPFLSHRFCDFDPGISPISLKVKFNGTKIDLDEIFTMTTSLNYVIWESYKPKTVSAPFLSIFVSSVLWFWPWHFSNFTQMWNSMVQVDRSRWDLYNDAFSFNLKLCYLRKL